MTRKAQRAKPIELGSRTRRRPIGRDYAAASMRKSEKKQKTELPELGSRNAEVGILKWEKGIWQVGMWTVMGSRHSAYGAQGTL